MNWRRHIPEVKLAEWAEGEIPHYDPAAAHLKTCAPCQTKLDQLCTLRAALSVEDVTDSARGVRAAIDHAHTEFPSRTQQGVETLTGAYLKPVETLKNIQVLLPTKGGLTTHRRAFLRLAFPLAVALALGSAAGVWVSQQDPPPTPDQTLRLYEAAAKAYTRFNPQLAVDLTRQAVRGKLVLHKDPKEPPFMSKFNRAMYTIEENNRNYALMLAESGQIDKALEINRLIAHMGDQLLEQKEFYGIEATNMYVTELAYRKELYLAAGDRVKALEADREMKRKRALDIKKTKRLMSELINNRGLYLTWGKGDIKVAQIEAKLIRLIREIWRPS